MNPGPLKRSLTAAQSLASPHEIGGATSEKQISGGGRFGIDSYSTDKHPSNFVKASTSRTPEQRAERQRIISEFLQASIPTS